MICAIRIGTALRNLAAVGAVAALLLVCAASGDAKTWTVTTTADSPTDAGSLRYIVSNAGGGDTIKFTSDGTTLTDALSLEKKLTIEGPATIRQTGGNRIFHISAGASVTLRKLTLTGGGRQMERGGAIFSRGSLTMEDCTVSENMSLTEGGGIFSEGTLTMKNCTVTGNSSYVAGGIINRKTSHGAKLTMVNCVVERNTAKTHCGGVSNEGTLQIDGGGIRNNSGGSEGDAGVYNAAGASAVVTNCTIMYNSCPHGSGGVNNEGTLNMTGCDIGSNNGGSCGGVENIGTLKLKECVISGNTSNCNGGGIYNHGRGSVTVEKCSITGNGAAYVGGGICHYESSFDDNPAEKCRLTNCTVVKGNGPDQIYGPYKADANCEIGSTPNKSATAFSGYSGETEPEPRSILGDADVVNVKNALADPASDLFAAVRTALSNDLAGISGDAVASLYYANTFEGVAVTSTDLVVEYTASYPARTRYYAIFARADGSGYELPDRGVQFELQAGQTLPDGVTPPDFYEEGEGLTTWRNVVTDGGSYDLEPAVGVVTFRVCSIRAAESTGDTGSGGGCNAGASAAEGAPLVLLLALRLLTCARSGRNTRK